MRKLKRLDRYRQFSAELQMAGTIGGNGHGVFMIRSKVDNEFLRIIASSDYDWDHVSVSRHDRVPNWDEMCQIKDLFFEEDETVMQLHPPKKDYVNNCSNCLHLWRSQKVKIPTPPAAMVGVPGLSEKQIRKMSREERDTIAHQALAAVEKHKSR